VTSFRAVIQHGLPFMNSTQRAPISWTCSLTLAQGYETWWSLSQAVAPTGTNMEERWNLSKYQQVPKRLARKPFAYYERFASNRPAERPCRICRRVCLA